jgi:hypothetical protein
MLRSANNTPIRCWGQRSATVELEGKQFEFPFLLADVRFPIIGIDFLRHFNLIVDVNREKLLPRTTLAQPVGGDVFAVSQQALQPAAAARTSGSRFWMIFWPSPSLLLWPPLHHMVLSM